MAACLSRGRYAPVRLADVAHMPLKINAGDAATFLIAIAGAHVRGRSNKGGQEVLSAEACRRAGIWPLSTGTHFMKPWRAVLHDEQVASAIDRVALCHFSYYGAGPTDFLPA